MAALLRPGGEEGVSGGGQLWRGPQRRGTTHWLRGDGGFSDRELRRGSALAWVESGEPHRCLSHVDGEEWLRLAR
jgi:hypothetical protein